MALHKSLTGGGSRGGRVLLAGNRDRRRGNGLRLGWGGAGWILGSFPHGKGGQALAQLPRAVLECPSLFGFQSPVDVALGDMGSGGLGSAGNGWAP